jgi:hypothetical protein
MLDVTLIAGFVGVLLMFAQQVLKNRAVLQQYHRTIALSLCTGVAVILTFANGGFDTGTLITTLTAAFAAGQAAYALLPSDSLNRLFAPSTPPAPPRG